MPLTLEDAVFAIVVTHFAPCYAIITIYYFAATPAAIIERSLISLFHCRSCVLRLFFHTLFARYWPMSPASLMPVYILRRLLPSFIGFAATMLLLRAQHTMPLLRLYNIGLRSLDSFAIFIAAIVYACRCRHMESLRCSRRCRRLITGDTFSPPPAALCFSVYHTTPHYYAYA